MKNGNYIHSISRIMEIELERDKSMDLQEFINLDDQNFSTHMEHKNFESNKKRNNNRQRYFGVELSNHNQ